MDDDIIKEFLLFAKTNALLSAFAVCTMLSISDGELLYANSTTTLPLLHVSLAISAFGLVFPGLILCGCFITRLLLSRILSKKEEAAGSFVAFAFSDKRNPLLSYSLVFGVPILASLYCIWRVSVVPSLKTAICLLLSLAIIFSVYVLADLMQLLWSQLPEGRRGRLKRWPPLLTMSQSGLLAIVAVLAVTQILEIPPTFQFLPRQSDTIKLAGLKLDGFSAGNAYFYEANFSNTTLHNANLKGAYMANAVLAEATIDETKADRAVFTHADMRGMKARTASFNGAYMEMVDARSAVFADSVMQGVKAGHMSASGGDFQGIDAVDADFSYSTLTNAHFWGANMASASLKGADLRGAQFGGAILEKADLKCALIQGAKLDGAKELQAEQLQNTMGDETTKLPAGIERPEMWKHLATFEITCGLPRRVASR